MAEETLRIVITGEDKVSNTLGGIKGKLSGLGDVAKNALGVGLGMGLSKIPGLAMSAVGSIGDLVSEAADVEKVSKTFDKLAESIGTTADALIVDMRAATRGMINDADLMQASNKFMAMGLAESSEEAASLAEMATQLGMAMGEDATSSMENFALMMANQSIPRLDSFGISSGKVRERIEELMASTEGLTREQAFNQAVMEQGALTMAKVGEQGDSTAAGMARLQSTFDNVKSAIGGALLPVVNALLQPLGDLAQKYGPQITAWAEQAGVWLGENLPKAIAWLSATWREVWPQIQSALQTAWGVIEPVFRMVQGWLSNEGPGALQGLQGTVNTVTEAVRSFISERFGWVIAWFKDNWPLIQETAETVMAALRKLIEVVLGAIRDFWEQHGEAIMAYIQNMWTIISTIWDTALKTIFDLIKGVLQLITGDTEGFKQTMEGIWTRLKDAGATIFRALKDNLLLLWNGLLEAIRSAWDGFVGWISGVGSNIVGAIRSGIEGAWGAFKDWLGGKINDLIGSVLGALGIHSDSAVFVAIGKNLMHALQAGIESEAHLPEVSLRGVLGKLLRTRAVAGGVPGIPTTGLPLPVGGVGAGGGVLGSGRGATYIINNHFGRDSVRSDNDIETIARRIEELLIRRGVREFAI